MLIVTTFASFALSSAAWALPGADAQWSVLSNGDPRIECTEVDSQPWCRSTGTVPLPLDKVSATLENMAAHQDLFESIVSIEVLAPDTMHIVLDFPSPLSDRDYVAKYTRSTEGSAHLYRWESVQRADAPEVDGVVRLPRMAGEWRLEPAGAETRVTYLWHAEIAGSFPSFALNQARKKAGSEALKDIRNAAIAASNGK
jgi:hypothetical protein